MMRKRTVLGVLLVAAACSKGDGGTNPGVVTTVVVSASPTQISVNETAQASFLAKDQNGSTLTGKTASWTSLNPAVASVTPTTGVIKGVSAGSATIRGTVDGVNGTADIIVIAPVSACNAGVTLVDLPPGGIRTLTSAETKGCIKVSASPNGSADYLVIPANTSSTPDDVGDYVFKSDEGETVPNNNLIPSNSITAANASVRASSTGADAVQMGFEMSLRLEERRELHLGTAQVAYRARQLDPQQRYSMSTAIPAVGDRTTFKVPQQKDPCNKFNTITAAVEYVNDKVIIYSDIASPANGFTSTDFQQIGDEFANLIYPTDVSYFGTPLDLDNNSRVIILYTPEVNKLTTAGSTSFVGGFFFAGDLFPATGANSCAQSNLGELFYVLTPDPDGTVNSNKRSTSVVRQGTRGTIAHEFQHMINASNRIRSPILDVPFEDVWLDEGLAHFAEDAVGRAIRGIGEADDANFSTTLGGNANDFNAFFFQNFSRFKLYLQNPGPSSPVSFLADSSLAARGASWAFLHYTADQYAPGGDVKAFTNKLAGGPDIGITNLTKSAGGVDFSTLVSGWMVANWTDDTGIAGLSSLYSYKVYNVRNIEQSLPANGGVYPLTVNEITGSSFAMSGLKARSGSGNYFFISRNPGAPARSFRFLNVDGATAASFTGATWIVVRTR